MNLQTRRLVENRNVLGEGPLWDPVDRVIYWVDILGRSVWRADADGGNARDWPVPAHIGALALRTGRNSRCGKRGAPGHWDRVRSIRANPLWDQSRKTA